ncbi:bifunctional UDP-N-acetylglucosamine diphosphorylase/glucosamine-1-phosphate N-acetyltransferase GlmU [Leeia oryzae]|uniref:bifunctional UDP-N-acetylglucosamine diphosphorylase/glucosamine-1-phosphate N-acetyltransferase GlmU n=1 Tax=Leeia oryzae TaxID=356662 RepID=UPI0005267EF3|nr:bifunctional UDP-N-acetylglucosamine diphosphorylase/glucosamine-1-phosphate N-acetyltransferase GlmU [Leeia oryzae]
MASPLHVVILAGGKGTRMYSKLPKVLHQIGGKPMLGHVIDCASRLTPENLVVIYGHEGELVKASMGNEQLTWVLQEPQLGTGHAMQCAAPALPPEGMTFVLYGDVPLLAEGTLNNMLAVAGSGEQVVLLTQLLDDPSGYGRIVRDAQGAVSAIVEHKDASPEQLSINEINTGILLLPNRHLHRWLAALTNNNAQGEYYLTDLIGLAVQDGVIVETVQPGKPWETLGVNNKLQLAELERHYQSEVAQQLMLQGVTLRDPSRLDVRGQLRCGQDVMIDVNCVFEGDVVLGDDVVIGPNCVLKDCTLAAGTQIAAYSHIDGAMVGEGARIGPFARLRPGAELSADVHIGNFVEIKKSKVGLGSKVNHLSYVGDAKIGAGVNVGAGTITCNYDGANKSLTEIGDGAFIGSGSMLVAPVTIGVGATIGAGSTITKPAPDNVLTVARAKQLTITNWQRPVKKKD